MTRIVTITEDESVVARIEEVLDDSVQISMLSSITTSSSMRPVAEQIAAKDPDAIVIGPDIPLDWALAVGTTVERSVGPIPVLLLTTPSMELWSQATRSGIRELIDVEATDDDVRTALESAIATASTRITAAEPARRRGRVITIASPKGGSGKTFVASNLAVGLARLHPSRVVLADFDVHFGDVDTALGLEPEYSIVDLIASGGEIDATALKIFLSRYGNDLYVLGAPDSLLQSDQVTPEAAARIIEVLRDNFDYVVIDTSSGLDERGLEAMAACDDLVLLAETDIPSVKAARKLLEALDMLGSVDARRHLVLNRSNARVGLRQAEAETALGMAIDANIPSSRAVPQSFNQGLPVIESAPRTPPAKACNELVARLAATPALSTGGR